MLQYLYTPLSLSNERPAVCRRSVLPLRSIRTVDDAQLRIWLSWLRLVYVSYRVRRIRRTIAHGFAYLSRWKQLHWSNTKRSTSSRSLGPTRQNRGEAAPPVDLEADDPELATADVIDAVGGSESGTLVRAWCSLTSLCFHALAARFLPFTLYVVLMLWGVFKAILGYVLHVIIVAILETTYVRRMGMTFAAMVVLKIAYWCGLVPISLDDLSRHATLTSGLRLLS